MEPFKNHLNEQAACKIAQAIYVQYPQFDRALFSENLSQKLQPLALKERMRLLAQRLIDQLPQDIEYSFDILVRALKNEASNPLGLSGFLVWPLTEVIAQTGMQDFECAMNALKETTKVFTSEFAVRPFFIEHESKTLEQFSKWLNDPNEHVRRLVSEGSRPLLPWGQKLSRFVENPHLTWPFLDALKGDPALYVRKSVANHINDHSKKSPEFVLDRLQKWQQKGEKNLHIEWLIRHATRTLIKKGVSSAFELQGITQNKVTLIDAKIITPSIKLGMSLKVEVVVFNQSPESVRVMLDHELDLLRANGKHHIKVFKGKIISLASGETQKIALALTLKAVTVRRYYSGRQFWCIKLNGCDTPKQPFELIV